MSDEEHPGPEVRALMRGASRGALATALAREDARWPYASLVLVALAHDASPLLLLSDLADHSRNIAADPRVSLLFDGTAGWGDPLAGPRATVLGRAEAVAAPDLKARFLARHPGARAYAGFADFRLYRVAVTRAHLVAGFGRIHWVDAAAVLLDVAAAAPLAAAEAGILEHMNRDHGDAVQLIAAQAAGLEGAGWEMIGIDPEGLDLRRRAALARVAFERPVVDSESARRALVRLAKQARQAAGEA